MRRVQHALALVQAAVKIRVVSNQVRLFFDATSIRLKQQFSKSHSIQPLEVAQMPSREQLQVLLDANPTDEFLQYSVAMACASEGNEEEAVERLKTLCTVSPDHVSAWFQRGQILNRLDETDEAREVLLAGIAAAQRVGDSHAEEEMRAFIDML